MNLTQGMKRREGWTNTNHKDPLWNFKSLIQVFNMRWTSQQLRDYETRRSFSRAQPEQTVRHDALAEKAGEAFHSDRVLLRVTSFRCRLLDPDNLCPKYFIDCCRYAGLIPDDSPEFITLQVTQEKVKTKSEERTEIEIL